MEEELQNQTFTQIASGTEINADLISNKDIFVSGTLIGSIETTSLLTLQQPGKITGKIIAANFDISGSVKGEIRVHKKLLIRSSAVIEGDIYTSEIMVEEGAVINGNIRSGDQVDIEKDNIPAQQKFRKSEIKHEAPPKKEVIQEPASPSRYVANVLISLRDSKPDQAVLSKLTDACQSFMGALNYNLDTFDDPVHDPFFQKLVFVNKTSKTEKDIQDNFMRAKELLETAFMRKNENHDDKLSKAAAEIVSILKEMNDYVMLLGNVMIVQYSDESVQSLAIELVSSELISILKRNERLAHQPKELYKQLTEK